MSKLLEQLNSVSRTTERLGGLFQVKTGGTPSRLKPEYYSGGNIPWVKTQELVDSVIFDTSEKITQEAINNSNAKVFPAGSVILAMYGATVGKLGKLGINASTNQACATFIPNNNADVNYLYFLLLKYRKNIISEATGSAQQNLSVDKIRNLEFIFPDLPTQKKIAEILSAYDAKIENNDRIIKKLEATAQVLFDEWFVNFRFPGHKKVKFVDSEMGEIPEGWEVLKMKDIFTFVKGKKPREISESEKEGFLQQILIDSFDGGKRLFASKEGMVVASEEDLLMVMDGASSGRIEFGICGVVGSTLSKLDLKRSIRTILYLYLKSKEKDIKENTTGSAIPHTDKDKVYNYEIVLPQNVDFLEKRLFKFIELIKKIKEENISLKSQRDQLLAKLI